MHNDPAIRLLRDLVAINSVNPTLVPGAPGEQEIAAAVAAEMRRLGLEVSVETVAPSRPNVVGVLEGRAKGRTLMFCGHTDTVGVTGMRDPRPARSRRRASPPAASSSRRSLTKSIRASAQRHS
jgi:acetylornithine deacetylase